MDAALSGLPGRGVGYQEKPEPQDAARGREWAEASLDEPMIRE